MTRVIASIDSPARVRRRHEAVLAITAVAGLAAAEALGLALHANTTGTALDQWFQRVTKEFSAQPGQPGFHFRSYWLLTRALLLGRPPGVLVVAGVAGLLMATTTSTPRSRLVNTLTPLVAVGLAGSGTEWLIKDQIGRRMAGNLSVLTYPSGHSVGTAAVAGCVVFTLLRCRTDGWSIWRRPAARRTVEATFALVSLGVGLDMAILRAHFLTDVVGGWMLGVSAAAMTCLLASRLSRPRRPR